jgi:hypothetical protein
MNFGVSVSVYSYSCWTVYMHGVAETAEINACTFEI